MSYTFLDRLTVADVAFIAKGKTLEEVFEQAALAVTNTMVKDLSSVKPFVTKIIKVKENTLEKLLFNFLQELIFLKDTKLLLFSKFAVKIKKGKENFSLLCQAKGEKIDMHKHELLVDVKAVTMHHFSIQKIKIGWKAQVVLDV